MKNIKIKIIKSKEIENYSPCHSMIRDAKFYSFALVSGSTVLTLYKTKAEAKKQQKKIISDHKKSLGA